VLAGARDALARAVTEAEHALRAGGRIVYVGAGTPGRLAALDAAECVPTFGVSPDLVRAVLAGGDEAAGRAVEGAEDDTAAGATDLMALAVDGDDLVVGITASGRTPYVLSALDAARAAGATTVAIVNNPGSPAAALADVAVELLTGPEVISGSTRLTAGTAQKIALNVLSTAAMVRWGRTHGPWMIDVLATNEKLRRRAQRMLTQITGASDEQAAAALDAAGGDTRAALRRLLG
jgi:N-acetylmuramic acid 6-phosphate etherase